MLGSSLFQARRFAAVSVHLKERHTPYGYRDGQEWIVEVLASMLDHYTSAHPWLDTGNVTYQSVAMPNCINSKV